MKLTASTAATYAAMLGKLLPRGPIWDGAQAALGALMTALGAELNEVHARLVQVMEEAYPNTADETLSDWLRVWGLPGPCSTMPATDDGKRELLAGKVAAQGGQSRAYYIGIVRAILGDLAAEVTITERPYGAVFRAWSGRAWDPVNGTGLAHHWRVTLPSGTTPSQVDAVDCVLQAYKPAHTVLEVVGLVSAYYSSPGGAGDYLEASTALAARVFFPGPTDLPSWSIGYWFEPAAFTSGQRMLTVSAIDYDNDGEALIVGLGDDYGGFVALYNTDSDEFSASLSEGPGAPIRLGVVSNGVVIKFYENGALVGTSSAIGGTFAERDALRFFNDQLGTKPAAGTVRNITINDRAHSGAEEAALAAAGYRHDVRAPFGDDWAGETPPIYWCRSALPGGRVTHYYTVEAGETLSFIGPIDPGKLTGTNAAGAFFFRLPNGGTGDVIIYNEAGYDVQIVARYNDATTFTIEFDGVEEATLYDCEEWVSVVINAHPAGSYAFIDGVELAHEATLAGLGGNPIFGDVANAIEFDVAGIHYFRRLADDEIASLASAGVTHDPVDVFANWPGLTSPVEWVGAPDVDEVPNAGTDVDDPHPLEYTASPLPFALLGAPVGRVPNSGSAGTCDLLLYGSTTSEED